jgi:hypothetical protein
MDRFHQIRRRQSIIILRLPRISDAGGFVDSGAIDIEYMQQRRIVALRMRAHSKKCVLVQMEGYLGSGVMTPEADTPLRNIEMSACIRKMECHLCVPMRLRSHAAADNVAVRQGK